MAEEQKYEEIEAPKQIGAPADAEVVLDDGSMSLIAHLTELRSRLIKCLVATAIGSCVGYFFIQDIMHYITLPAGKLYYMQPAEAFFTYLKVACVAGFLLALPIIFWQVWRFFLPALTTRERMVLGIVVPTSVVLFFCGLAFSFFLVLPAGIKFFLGFGNTELEALLSVNKYFDFVIMFVLPFGFIFELPLVMTIMGKLGLITSAFLKKYQRIIIFLSFVVGAIITPTPDVFTQSMIALPIIVLYEVGYFIVRYILRR
ncbi:putative Sec-independent protein translocase, TatC [Selenomonas ruminantium subsp. lactilytica TAM6421]|uniref:Sec-independent protein translocase protein TatC n=1 Tax=Selenomonas ruminantium subsp. lactilytica (strain NBRC 103574 / TAM6421) TaxID=927704 RepID=I0GQ21_SELRL|nr:twin-arginine translocase subunit TatC [Selenomonas ruminantium]BAL82858.1 putative Sec-independent protein translocase, TatC [Selenomonas ruminantium subsp. lactilytica TAM6421]